MLPQKYPHVLCMQSDILPQHLTCSTPGCEPASLCCCRPHMSGGAARGCIKKQPTGPSSLCAQKAVSYNKFASDQALAGGFAISQARQSGKQAMIQQGHAHPSLGGLNVKACFLHGWPGCRASEAHLVIHVCVVDVTCICHTSLSAITHIAHSSVCIPSGQQRFNLAGVAV